MKSERAVPLYEISCTDVTRRNFSHNYPLHWHDYFEIEFVVSGSGKQLLNGKEYTLESGTLYILTPNDFHAVYPDKPLTLFNVSFQSSELPFELIAPLTKGGGTCIQCHSAESARFASIFNLLYDAKENIKHDDYFKTILSGLLILIKNKLPTHDSVQYNAVQSAKLYIQTNFRQNPSLTEIAKAVYLTPNYLCDKFRKETGKTVLEYLTAQKIKYAESLLKSTNLSVTDICFSSGFSSVSNFLRAFKMHKKTSPLAYRKTIK
ncbi:MAG: AraC family transcriptional regulator [Clostridia bacterium]|nr:AraC family transcriptional regulator [Clostridia bacterium]